MEKLNKEDLDVIIESLKYTKLKFENYPIGPEGYPSYEFKQKRISEVKEVINKVKVIYKNI